MAVTLAHMTKLVLIRHGRSTANADGILAGRMPGIALDEVGRRQAAELGDLLSGANLAAVYTSPVERCRETAALAGFPEADVVEALTECDYGDWTGSKLESLVGEPVWAEIQATPSLVTFPGGESMSAMFDRVTLAATTLAERHGPDGTVVVFSHGDPIKAILAHAFGMPRDEFQRVHVAPGGISVIEYRPERPMVLCVNAGGPIAALLAALSAPTVGGGDVAGPSEPRR